MMDLTGLNLDTAMAELRAGDGKTACGKQDKNEKSPTESEFVGHLSSLDLDAAMADMLASSKGAIEEPEQYDELAEGKIRELIQHIAYYDETGPGFDPEGKYLCGTCTMRIESTVSPINRAKCSHVSGPISMTIGSCEIYQIGDPLWPVQPVQFSQKDVLYSERPLAKGFGCSRCGLGHPARQADVAGRQIWCVRWGARVRALACCREESGPDLVEAPGE